MPSFAPEESLTRYISKLIEFPASLQVRSFAGGRACLASVRARLGAQGTGLTIQALRTHIPQLHLRVVAIYRRFADGPGPLLCAAIAAARASNRAMRYL